MLDIHLYLLYKCEVAKLGTAATGTFLMGGGGKERARDRRGRARNRRQSARDRKERERERADNKNQGQRRIAQLVYYRRYARG